MTGRKLTAAGEAKAGGAKTRLGPVPATEPIKLTQLDLEKKVVGTDCHRFPGTTVTVCLLKLQNGFSVVGQSACVDPTAFDKEIGEKLAYDDAMSRLWQLEGYLLAERMAQVSSLSERQSERKREPPPF